MISITLIFARGWIAAKCQILLPALLLLFGLGACGDNLPTETGNEAPTPSGEDTRTTAVDTAVIGDGVFTARTEEPEINRFGFRVERISVHVRNVGKEPIAWKFHRTELCHFWPRVYTTPARNLDAPWDPSRTHENICTLQSQDFELEAGGEMEVQNATGFVAEEVLGDSLPEGWYHPTVTIAPFGVLAELKVDSVHLVRR